MSAPATAAGVRRRIVVSALDGLRSGVSARTGRAWTLFKVTAAAEDGTVIGEKLVSFSRLPIGEPVEVEVLRREHPQHGTSFTVQPVRSRGAALARRVEDLERAVVELQRQVAKLRGSVS